MTTFIVVAVVLTILSVVAIIFPLLRKNTAHPVPAVWAAFGAAGVLVFGAGGLYLTWTNWSWSAAADAAQAVTPENMVSRLARRLEKNPNDLEGWLRLGQSYTVLEQYPLAVRAYQRANELGDGKNAEALLGMGQALTLNDVNELQGRAGKLIEQALELEPKNETALFYGAAAALRRGELPLARQRFSTMLELDPPDNVKPILREQIARIDQALEEGGGAASGDSAGVGAAAAGVQGPQAGSAGSQRSAQPAPGPQQGGPPEGAKADADVPPVRVRVTISPKLSGEVQPSYPLFVIVRDPRQAGPPLAVKRLQASFPQSVELSASDAMMPGRSFAKGQLVEVVARVSKTGNAIAAPGDFIGLAAHRVGDGGVVDIQIEHVSP